MFALVLTRMMYDRPGEQTTMARSVRKWQNRPALAAGETVTVVRCNFEAGRYADEIITRVLVRNASGAERWVDGMAITPFPEDGRNAKAFDRLSEIAAEILSN